MNRRRRSKKIVAPVIEFLARIKDDNRIGGELIQGDPYKTHFV